MTTQPQPWRPILLPGETMANLHRLGRPVPTFATLPILPTRNLKP
jgi:hypothetical protein